MRGGSGSPAWGSPPGLPGRSPQAARQTAGDGGAGAVGSGAPLHCPSGAVWSGAVWRWRWGSGVWRPAYNLRPSWWRLGRPGRLTSGWPGGGVGSGPTAPGLFTKSTVPPSGPWKGPASSPVPGVFAVLCCAVPRHAVQSIWMLFAGMPIALSLCVKLRRCWWRPVAAAKASQRHGTFVTWSSAAAFHCITPL